MSFFFSAFFNQVHIFDCTCTCVINSEFDVFPIVYVSLCSKVSLNWVGIFCFYNLFYNLSVEIGSPVKMKAQMRMNNQ